MLQFIFSMYRKLFAREGFIKFNRFLYNCSIRGLGVYNYENMNVSGENSFINSYIKEDSLKNNDYIVFDIGANKGDYSKLILQSIPNAKIFSFEPHPVTFKILSDNCLKLNGIKLFNCALSSEKGFLELYDYKSKDGSSHASLSSEIFTTVHNAEIVSHKVDVSTIDTICKEHSIEKIDFLKIDVEGYELDVLKGSKTLLQNNKVKFIQFEFTQLNSTTRIFFKDFWELLSVKYKIYRLLPNGLLEIKRYDPTINEIFGYQNFVAIHKEL
ncbi:MAG: FkbM family methyltransferase [SAR324 cluster bacterium]|uniref:FkbM family methyltransferase n=1 Tax=SAR324 cluster bacterium TaxID=2024889 RepID=A0A2A4T3S2_9DELT|nr:MAG: FkbM family methyltransferase [SAR324 cluster bacterium]